MLKGLITSLLVSMGVVSPTTNTPSFNNDQQTIIKYENDNRQTYDVDIDLDRLPIANNIAYAPGDDDEYNDKHIASRVSTTNYDDTLNIRINRIVSQVQAPDTDGNYENFFYYSRANNKYNFTALTILRITPYRNVLDNSLSLRIRTNVFPSYQVQNNIYLETSIISTISSDVSRFVDEQNWGQPYRNTTIYNELTDPENGYNYNEIQTSYQVSQNNQLIAMQNDLQIVNGKTNYIFIYQYLKNNDLYSYVNNTNLSGTTANWCELNEYTIDGYFIPPIDTYEVVDIPGLAFTILTMPFSFISTAFNLTLFPGTPYEINISQLFLAIIALLVFIFIIKKLIQAKLGM